MVDAVAQSREALASILNPKRSLHPSCQTCFVFFFVFFVFCLFVYGCFQRCCCDFGVFIVSKPLCFKLWGLVLLCFCFMFAKRGKCSGVRGTGSDGPQ